MVDWGGRIVYARTISGSTTSRGCQDNKPAASPYELTSQTKADVKEQLRKDVAPYFVTMEIKLMDSKDGITSDQAKAKFEQGVDFGKNQRMDRACELWGEARILSPNSPSILYNLGVCSEITGDPEKALDLYAKADRLLNTPDDNITKALKRTNEQVKKHNMLKEQMASVNTPPPAALKKSPISAQQPQVEQPQVVYVVTIKAAGVRSKADAKSKSIKNLKKGEKLEKIDISGNWINVKLSSGETGWIHKSMVKEEK